MKRFENFFEDCYVKCAEGILHIGNDMLERTWKLEREIPTVCSLKNKLTGKEWFSAEERYDWLEHPKELYAFYKKGITEGVGEVLDIKAYVDDDCGIAPKAFHIVLLFSYEHHLVEWNHLIYPGTPVLRSYLRAVRKEEGMTGGFAGTGKVSGVTFQDEELTDDFSDSFPLEPKHCGWESVHFLDRTDDNDNLVHAQHGLINRRESRYMHGNLLFLRDNPEEEGLILVKEGPTPFSYLGDTKSDFFVKGQNVFTTGWGFENRDFQRMSGKTGEAAWDTESLTSYGSAVILWSGDRENAYMALNEYHKARHMFVPEKDAFLMSNTWGDQSSDGKIGETFLLDELRKAKELGINLYQIDDGWQKGTTCNSVNASNPEFEGAVWGEGYYKTNPEFWSVHDTRLPRGLEPIMEYAGEHGIRIGLWFSPDSDNDFANWEKDSETLLGLHKKYGIAAFKMDGIRLKSKVGEENLGRLLRRVITETQGKVFFNMDVTAETRGGYFGRMQYGSLFVENRFTGNFGHWPNYYPHCTLRNLWMLSLYYPTNRLQMEFVNVKRNTELYQGDVLAPAVCGLEYSLAVTLFANPLAWMELTGLDEESSALLQEIIPKYLRIQGDILSGNILPIGEEPDGTRFTGFQSIKGDGEGYLLVIKERSKRDSFRYKIWKERNTCLKLECILGQGKQDAVSVDEEGNAVFTLDGQFQYALYHYEVQGK